MTFPGTTKAASLADMQDAFVRQVLDEDAPLPAGWGASQRAGIEVYRGNYRAALMGAMDETYERTARLLGEAAFRQAAINHVIAHPPAVWTIADVGHGFAETCARMFADRPEISELAWLEGALSALTGVADSAALEPGAFADQVAGFGDEDWAGLTLTFHPHAQVRLVDHDLTSLWKALGQQAPEMPAAGLETPRACLVWREGERPTFILAEADHAAAFAVIAEGGTYGDLIEALLARCADPGPQDIQHAAMRAGEILGHWLREGFLARSPA